MSARARWLWISVVWCNTVGVYTRRQAVGRACALATSVVRPSCQYGSIRYTAIMSDTDAISVSQLISLVRERPVLWDRQREVYKNRKLTKKAWAEICELLVDNYEELDEHHKKSLGKLSNKCVTFNSFIQRSVLWVIECKKRSQQCCIVVCSLITRIASVHCSLSMFCVKIKSQLPYSFHWIG